jgi:hypothetical protein
VGPRGIKEIPSFPSHFQKCRNPEIDPKIAKIFGKFHKNS